MKTTGRSDVMDEYLATLNLWRKPIAKDGSCLFRAVSEQLFNTQAYHVEVREACIRYMENHRDQFEAFIEGPFDHYLYNLQYPKEWAGQVEISALSQRYKRDFIVYQRVGQEPVNVTENNYKDKISLCFTGGNHYDIVYPYSEVEASAFCQSIVYEVLYKSVFGIGDCVNISKTMISNKGRRRDSTCSERRDSTCSEPDVRHEGLKDEPEGGSANVDQCPKESKGVPFPYRVAKALDPDFYRNTELDWWMEAKKEDEANAEQEFAPGDKCQVTLEGDEKLYSAFVQEITPDRGPVTVYIEDLGEKQTVPHASLRPIAGQQGWANVYGKNFRNLSGYYQKLPLHELECLGKRGKGRKKGKELPILMPFGRGQGLPQRLVQPDCIGRGNRGRGMNSPTRARSKSTGGYEDHDSRHSEESSSSPSDLQKRESDAFPALPTQNTNGPRSFWNGSSVSANGNLSPHPADQATATNSSNTNGSPYSRPRHLSQPSNQYCTSHPVNSVTANGGPAMPVPNNHMVTTSLVQPAPQCIPQLAAQSQMCAPAAPGQYAVVPQMVMPHMETLSGPVNFSVLPSRDASGADLPLNDPNTLRFFFNLGHEYYRQLSMVQQIQQTPQMYSSAPYVAAPMAAPTVTIPQVQTVMEAGAACGPDVETNGQCEATNHKTGSSVGPHKRDVVYVRDLERSYDVVDDRHSPSHDPPNNDSGCVSDVSSGNGEVLFSPTLGNIYAPRHSISEISDHSDTSSQQSLSNSQAEGGCQATSTPNKGLLRNKVTSNVPHRNIRPMRDIPPRFKKMLAQRSSPAHSKYEGPPLVRQGGYGTTQLSDGVISTLDGDAPQFVPMSCMECSVQNQAYDNSTSYVNPPMPCMSSPYYYSQSHPYIEGGVELTLDSMGGEGYTSTDNLQAVSVDVPPMYTFQMTNPEEGLYEEAYMSNSVKSSSATGYMAGPGAAAQAQPQGGVVYYSNPSYPNPGYVTYGNGPPVMYSNPQPVQYMSYSQPGSAS